MPSRMPHLGKGCIKKGNVQLLNANLVQCSMRGNSECIQDPVVEIADPALAVHRCITSISVLSSIVNPTSPIPHRIRGRQSMCVYCVRALDDSAV